MKERPAEAPLALAEMAGGRRVVQVSVVLVRDVQMPSVRAYMVLAALAEMGETLACHPSPDTVETFAGTEIDAWIVSERADARAGLRGRFGAGRRRRRGRRGDRRRRRHAGGRARRRSARPGALRARAPRPSASTPSGSTS